MGYRTTTGVCPSGNCTAVTTEELPHGLLAHVDTGATSPWSTILLFLCAPRHDPPSGFPGCLLRAASTDSILTDRRPALCPYRPVNYFSPLYYLLCWPTYLPVCSRPTGRL